jgi:hypothetical protein
MHMAAFPFEKYLIISLLGLDFKDDVCAENSIYSIVYFEKETKIVSIKQSIETHRFSRNIERV